MADSKGRPWWASLLAFGAIALSIVQPELIPVTIPLIVIIISIT